MDRRGGVEVRRAVGRPGQHRREQRQTVRIGLADAGSSDRVGPTGDPNLGHRENPEYRYENGGEDIKLVDPGTGSHHAILWAGSADHMRHFNDVKGMYDVLKDKWGDPNGNPNVSITVLFGDGSKNSNGDDLPDA